MNIKAVLALAIIILLSSFTVIKADVTAKLGICNIKAWVVDSYDQNCVIHISIEGKITNSTLSDIKKIISTGELSPNLKTRFLVSKTIILDSVGGSFSEALEIGRFIREQGMFTAVPRDGKCFSACALIWLAGIYRTLNGELGFHRPWENSGAFSQLDASGN